MKKFLLLFVAAVMAVSANAQLAVKSAAGKAQNQTVVTAKDATKAPRFEAVGAKNIALNPIFGAGQCVAPQKAARTIENLPVLASAKNLQVDKKLVATSRAARGMKKAAPAAAAPVYEGNCNTYSGGAWGPHASWSVSFGEDEYQGEAYDVIWDVVPNDLFGSPVGAEYLVMEDGKTIIVPAQPFSQVSATEYAWLMDYTNRANGGYITLILEEDGTLSMAANHNVGYFKATATEDWEPGNVTAGYLQCNTITYTIPAEDKFTATASFTAKAKMRADGVNTSWTMQLGTLATEEGSVDAIRNLVDPAGISSSTKSFDVLATVAGNSIVVEPQLVQVTASGLYLYLSSLNNTTTGNIVFTVDEQGYISLPEGESLIIGAYYSEEFDPTRSANYAGYWEIFDNVKYYAEGQPIPAPAPEIIADATVNGQLFLGMSPSGYSYNYNLGLLPAQANMVVTNYTSDDATAWAWNADKIEYNEVTQENEVVDNFTGTEKNFTFPTTSGEYDNIYVIGWNQKEESDPFFLGKGKAKENSAFYAGGSQIDFAMSDGTNPIITFNNPDNTIKFYTNWATPDIYPSGSVATIYSYGCKPIKPLYIEGIELPFVSFKAEEDFNLTIKICKATRNGNSLRVGDVIAQCDVNSSNIDDSFDSGLTMVYADAFYVEDEDGMTEEIDHLFLDEEYCVIIEGFDNGTFSGVLGSQEENSNCPTTSWFSSTGSTSMRSYSGGWPTLFIGYAGATYGYLQTDESTDLVIPAEGGSATLTINPMLCSVDEEDNQTTRLFVEGEVPEWVELDIQNEDYADEFKFDLVITVEALAEGETSRSASFRVYQEGAYLDITVKQDMADGISTVVAKPVKTVGQTYNLAGQRINKAQKGVYIMNGQKVLFNK